jgi:hypothetical protein
MGLNAPCLFAGFQIGFSCAAHIVARPIHLGQQGRLQRRSLFLVLLRHDSGSGLEETDMTKPPGPAAGRSPVSATVKKLESRAWLSTEVLANTIGRSATVAAGRVLAGRVFRPDFFTNCASSFSLIWHRLHSVWHRDRVNT